VLTAGAVLIGVVGAFLAVPLAAVAAAVGNELRLRHELAKRGGIADSAPIGGPGVDPDTVRVRFPEDTQLRAAGRRRDGRPRPRRSRQRSRERVHDEATSIAVSPPLATLDPATASEPLPDDHETADQQDPILTTADLKIPLRRVDEAGTDPAEDGTVAPRDPTDDAAAAQRRTTDGGSTSASTDDGEHDRT
jgi:hypothetical protein